MPSKSLTRSRRKPFVPPPPPWTPLTAEAVVQKLAARYRLSPEHARVVAALCGLGPKEDQR
jgi:hypothetical protein